jgi:hypothetical protein
VGVGGAMCARQMTMMNEREQNGKKGKEMKTSRLKTSDQPRSLFPISILFWFRDFQYMNLVAAPHRTGLFI